MFCTQCGKQSGPDSKFCESCGSSLGAASGAPSTAAGAAVPPAQAFPPAPPAQAAYQPPPAYPAPPGYPPPQAYPPYVQMAPPPPKKSALPTVVVVLVVLAGLGYGAYSYTQKGGTVTVGTKDEVTYSGTATKDQATALGNALKSNGYFQDRGVTVLLDMGSSGTTISFVVQEGAWNQPAELFKFDEVGREVAGSVGGLPVKIQLMDSKEDVEKSSSVGEVKFTGGDSVVYEGEATQAQGQALGQQLQTIGYMTGKGVDVFVGRHTGATILSFVVADGVWNQPETVSGFEAVARAVAPSIGGLPVRLRMVSNKLEVEKDETVTADGATPVQKQPAQGGQQ